MHQRQLQKIQKMEAILNEMNQTLEEVNAAFEKRKALRPQIKDFGRKAYDTLPEDASSLLIKKKLLQIKELLKY